MCGICGAYAKGEGAAPVSLQLVERMRETMAHRGPDDSGAFVTEDRRLGLGHRRLSIIDLSRNGRQPMANEDGTNVVTYNGEIYNFAELRRRLESRGHKFVSGTDTEVLIHLYEEHGLQLLGMLRGMFAFALWDADRQELLLARDRLGIKPLYYTETGGCFLFASEIKALLASDSVKPRVCREAMYQYLAHGRVVPPLTLFEGIYKLQPGHWLVVSNERMRSGQYWDLFDGAVSDGRSAEWYVEEMANRFEGCVQAHLVSDVPVGVFLSGGVDSSLVAAMVARSKDVPLTTFTLGFDGHEEYNEFVYAREVADMLGSEHHEIKVGGRDLVDFFPRFLEFQEEPVGNPIWMAIYYLCDLARRTGVKVILSGDGGDELFAGYDKWMRCLRTHDRLWRYYESTPRVLRSLIHGIAAPLLGEAAESDVLLRAARGQQFFIGGSMLRGRELAQLLNPEAQRELEQHDPYAPIGELRSRFEHTDQRASYLSWMTYVSLKTGLLEDYLMRLDKMGMAASVEGRVPFLDHELVTFALSIPREHKCPDYENKALLKDVARRVFPDRVVSRRKMGFCAPMYEWVKAGLSSPLREAVMDLQGSERIFEETALSRRLGEVESGRGNPSAFWCLLNLSLWHRRWIGGERP